MRTEANDKDQTKTTRHRSVVGERIRSEKINLSQKLAARRVAIFGMHDALSAKCSKLHLPNIIGNKDELMKKGIEETCILTVNDPFVLGEWGRSKGIFKEKITLIGDAAAEFT